jgi:acyl carrier protein
MDSVNQKLTLCFATVFPKLDRARIPSAKAGQIPEWDSLAQVNLLSLIGEEFGIEVDFEEFDGATSFEAIAGVLSKKAAE